MRKITIAAIVILTIFIIMIISPKSQDNAEIINQTKEKEIDSKSNESSVKNNVSSLNNVYWNKFRAQDIPQVNSDWENAQLLPFNSEGWQEGDYISPDGNTFYFGYTDSDAFRVIHGFGNATRIGPDLPSRELCSHGPWKCGEFPRYDQVYVERTEDGWSEFKIHPLTIKCPSKSITLINNTRAYFTFGFGEWCDSTGFAFADLINGSWTQPTRISVLDSNYEQDDLYVNKEETELYFWSKRPAEFKNANIYRSVKLNDKWQTPELLPSSINSAGDDMMTFIFEDYLYFASSRQENGIPLGIYRSKIMENSVYSEPELVISSKIGVGEPSIPDDGSAIYFEQIITDGLGNFKADMLYAKRKR